MRKMHQMLATYQQPALDPGIAEALDAYVAAKKASMPDAFMLSVSAVLADCEARKRRASPIMAIRTSTWRMTR